MDFEIEEDLEDLEEGYERPPKPHVPISTKRASKQGYDPEDSAKLARIVELVRQHNVKRLTAGVNPRRDPDLERSSALAANRAFKVTMGNKGIKVVAGQSGTRDNANKLAAALVSHLAEKGIEVQSHVGNGPQGTFTFGVKPVMMKPQDVKEDMDIYIQAIEDNLNFVKYKELQEAAKRTYCQKCGTVHVRGRCPGMKNRD